MDTPIPYKLPQQQLQLQQLVLAIVVALGLAIRSKLGKEK
tara:strand:+ start:390 stop:509 length:120 start_codon:yes stop_codon:yes gene_type:complete